MGLRTNQRKPVMAPVRGAEPVEVAAPGLERTERLVLRPLRASDRAEFLRVIRISREHLATYSELHRPHETDEQLFERQVARATEGDTRATAWRRAGFLDDGRLVGCFNLHSIERGLRFECDANWWIAADQTGQGFASEGVHALLAHALRDLPRGLGLRRVRAFIMPGNVESARVATLCGMRPTGRQERMPVGGRWVVHDEFEIVAP
ncbi:MAG: GNAT family protein [Planctomycetota bacterium]|nr:GNAT family protein [Planctomycetota bacterium]